jgi:hypothetical protein
MGILRMLQRRRNVKALPEHASPEVIEKLLRGTKSEIRPPEVKHFQFVVILIDDKNPEQVPTMISTVMGTLVQHHANISNVTPSLFVALLGVPFPEGNSADIRRELVDALLQENGERIRIAHGQCDGAVGTLGGHGRWTYGAVIPGVSGVLKKLLEIKFGTAVEIC